MLLLLSGHATAVEANDWFGVWNNADKWYEAGHATLNPDQNRLLVGKPGTGVLLNGKTGRANSLVTKQTYQDVEVHVEFVVAKGSNSGVIFHGNYEIQILDSAHIEAPTGAHCGGVYPRAEGEPGKPSYRHIDAGSPPRVNAARPPGQWQSMDIIFQAPRFDEAGNKTANAKFVRVIHNGVVIQENHEMPHAHGPNWDRQQFPSGRVVLQGDYGPVAFRNIRVRPWDGKTDIAAVPGGHRRQTVESDAPHPLASVATLNVPPDGFTALFNGRDFTGLKMSPKAKEMWSIEDGALKAHGLLEEWGADLETEKAYQDFVLLVDFRMPAKSDAGIFFRRLIPDMGGLKSEEFKIRSENGMGILLSFQFMPENVKEGLGLEAEDLPRVKPVNPAIGVWHTVKLTVIGTRLTAELDGDRIIDNFQYPKGFLAIEPAPIRFQKHRFVEGARGQRNPCPIEYRNIFIKEIKPSELTRSPGLNVPPPGFAALFNGKDFTGWRMSPKAKAYWSIEDGVLKSPGLLKEWSADMVTEKSYRDFVLMLEFRMPTISDSGIMFRRLIPEIPGFGAQEQFNLRSKGGFGHLESYYFLPKETAEKFGLKESDKPYKQVRNIDPEVGVWHTVKLTMKGRTFSAEYDGEVIQDNFVYHDWMLNMEPAPIRLQKHIVTYGNTDMGRNLGEVNPCPIEYRNIFIRELGPGEVIASPKPSGKPRESSLEELLAQIDKNDLPEDYQPATHQDYVDRRIAKLSNQQMARLGKLWKEKQRLDPGMPNRGNSFVRILEYVAEGKSPPPATKVQEPKPGKNAPDQPGANKSRKSGNQWKWTAESDAKGEQRKTTPIKSPDGRTIHVAGFEISGDDKPPVVLLPDSRLSVSGRLATKCPVYFGITINHPNGDFAGRFQTVYPADEFRGGEDFEVTLELQDFQLDPSLADSKDKLPSQPFHFVVKTIWLHTLEKQAELEVIAVELVPPSEDKSK